MDQKLGLAVIIAVLNEERTICSIVETVRTWGKANEIVVVDDEATTDNTATALKHFSRIIKYIKNRKNGGRGEAIVCGINNSQSEIIMLLDGDLINLTHKDLDDLLKPLITGKAEMAVGVPHFWGVKGFEPWNDVSGTRVFRRKIVVSHLSDMRKTGYGIELFLNELHRQRKIVNIPWPHVFVLNKFTKQSVPDAVKSYIREAGELMTQVIKNQSKDLAPHAKKVVKEIQNYLKQALEYFQ